MFVELHILQNFAPSNLNRDESGAPKDCEFGGYRRARISSQCIKRALRRDSEFADLLAEHGGLRTRRLILELAERLDGQSPASDSTVKLIAEVFREGGIERPQQTRGEDEEKDNTRLIFFIDRSTLDSMAETFRQDWSDLKAGQKPIREQVRKRLGQLLAYTVKSPDIALFGRMIEINAKTPFGKLNLGRDAACQVAHAISTNRVSVEFDFFTAVEELSKEGERGAAMMDTSPFNSACYYRYSNVDLGQLARNLGGDAGDAELAERTLRAFVQGSISAVPTGKQNSMAAQNPPAFVMAVARRKKLWSLANAFLQPVHPDSEHDLAEKSVFALDKHWGQLARMYGEADVVGKWCVMLDDLKLTSLADSCVPSVEALVEGLMETVRTQAAKAEGGPR